MPQLIEEPDHDPRETRAAERRDNSKQRAKLKASLNDVGDEVTQSLREAGIAVSVFFTVPSSGPLMTFATPIDPTDQEWTRVSEIVVQVVSRALGVNGLISQPAPCVATVPMAAADLLTNSDTAGTDV